MQTPIEQLIERLEAMRDKILQEIEKLPPVCIGKIELCAKRDALSFTILEAKELLDVERSRLESARADGRHDFRTNGAMFTNDNKWFNEQFKNVDK